MLLRGRHPLLLRLQLGQLGPVPPRLVLQLEQRLEQRGLWQRGRVARLLLGWLGHWLVLRRGRPLGGGRGVEGMEWVQEMASLMMGRVRLGRHLWREV